MLNEYVHASVAVPFYRNETKRNESVVTLHVFQEIYFLFLCV